LKILEQILATCLAKDWMMTHSIVVVDSKSLRAKWQFLTIVSLVIISMQASLRQIVVGDGHHWAAAAVNLLVRMIQLLLMVLLLWLQKPHWALKREVVAAAAVISTILDVVCTCPLLALRRRHDSQKCGIHRATGPVAFLQWGHLLLLLVLRSSRRSTSTTAGIDSEMMLLLLVQIVDW